MDGRMDGWMDERTDCWWGDRRIKGGMDAQNGCTDGCLNR